MYSINIEHTSTHSSSHVLTVCFRFFTSLVVCTGNRTRSCLMISSQQKSVNLRISMIQRTQKLIPKQVCRTVIHYVHTHFIKKTEMISTNLEQHQLIQSIPTQTKENDPKRKTLQILQNTSTFLTSATTIDLRAKPFPFTIACIKTKQKKKKESTMNHHIHQSASTTPTKRRKKHRSLIIPAK